jgi:hypothetical protein
MDMCISPLPISPAHFPKCEYHQHYHCVVKQIVISDSKFIIGYTTYVISSVCVTLIDHTALKSV